MAVGYYQLPAYRAPGGLDFSPINSALDDIKEMREKNRLLEEAKEIGAAAMQPQPSSGESPYQNRMLSSSPASGAAAAAGRPYAPSGGIADRIVGAESGGRADARNPRSSALGSGQFINSTWLNTIKSARPDLAAGKSDAELLALRTDPTLSREMTQVYADQNASALRSGGYEPTPGNTYLAHFAGPGGARKILGSDPSTPITQVMTPAAIQANPFLRNMTAGDVRSWADRKMGGGSAPSSAQPQAASAPAQSGGANYRAAANAAFKQGNVALGLQLLQRQQADEDRLYNRGREATSDARAAESHELNTQGAREELQMKFAQRVGGIAQTIASETDPARKSAMWQKFVAADPRIATSLQRYGVDPNDADAGARYLIKEATGLTGKKYEATKYGIFEPASGDIRPYPAGQGDQSDSLERAKYEQQLRKEYSALTTEKRTINDSVARVKTGANLDSGTGDLAIVYGYMKLLDPGSVVREGEFATAEQTAGLPQQIVGLYNKIINGERLTPAQRNQFVSAAEGLAADKEKRFTATRSQFENIARQAGSDPSRILLDEGGAPQQQDPGGNAPPAGAIQMLRGDPSPEAMREFDEIFGQGAAQRALGR